MEDAAPPPPSQPAPGYGPQRTPSSAAVDPETRLARRVLGDTEDVWGAVFQAMGGTYRAPTLVLFPGRVDSACGLASAAVGPFYCPGDQKLYLDTAFFDELARALRRARRFRAGLRDRARGRPPRAEPARASTTQVDAQRQRVRARPNNELSVRLELQADFFAGVWAHSRAAARQAPGAGRPRRGAARGRRHRRRPAAAAGAGLRRARLVHARHRRAARALVQASASRPATSRKCDTFAQRQP